MLEPSRYSTITPAYGWHLCESVSEAVSIS
jgi:hypothetical protein